MGTLVSETFNAAIAKALWPDANFHQHFNIFCHVTFKKRDGPTKFSICFGRGTQGKLDVLINSPAPHDSIEYSGTYHSFCGVKKVIYDEANAHIDFRNEHNQTLRVFKNGDFSFLA